MATGIKIINSHGTVLIDNVSPCLQMKAKYSVTIPTSGFVNVSVPNCVSPIFALRLSATNRRAYFQHGSTGSTRTVQISQGTGATSTLACVLYHFDVPTTSSSTHGIKVFSDSGDVVFDALAKNAVVAGYTSNFAQVDVNAATGRQYAFSNPAQYRRYMRDHDGSVYTNHHFRNAGLSLANGGVRLMPAVEVITGVELSDFSDIDILYSNTPQMYAIDVTAY